MGQCLDLDRRMGGAQRIDVLVDLWRQTIAVVVYEDPPGHRCNPMRTGAMEVLVYLGYQLGIGHLLGRVALEYAPCADAPAVALEVALGSIGTDLLEVGAKGVSGQTHEPVLVRRAPQSVERQPEVKNV